MSLYYRNKNLYISTLKMNNRKYIFGSLIVLLFSSCSISKKSLTIELNISKEKIAILDE